MTAHGGVISVGFPTVLIGDVGAGPGGLPVVRLPDGRLQVGSNIIIDGTPAFQAQVMNRLALIASTPSGRQLLANINSRPHTMTITEFTGPNSFAGADSWADATPAGQPVFNGAGNPVNSCRTWNGSIALSRTTRSRCCSGSPRCREPGSPSIGTFPA